MDRLRFPTSAATQSSGDLAPGPRLNTTRPRKRLSGRSGVAMDDPARNLRILIANERSERLAIVAPLVSSLGHEVIAREINSDEVGELTQRLQPDVALVGVGHDPHHALELIDHIVKESACPVIAILGAADDGFVREAAKLGVFAYIVDDDFAMRHGARTGGWSMWRKPSWAVIRCCQRSRSAGAHTPMSRSGDTLDLKVGYRKDGGAIAT